MNPVKIRVMDDDFLVFSLAENAERMEKLNGFEFEYAVFLSPSMDADYYIEAYSKKKKTLSDHYAAAVSAAAFLVLKRGLPLSEISFETASGFIDVFCTGSGLFTVSIQKCKHLYTKTLDVMGCDIRYIDILAGNPCRVINTKNIENFDVSCLPRFVTADENFPAAVVLSSNNGGEVDIVAYTDFNFSAPPRLSLFAAAAYSEKYSYGSGINFSYKTSTCRIGYSSVTVTTRPALVE